MYQLFREKTAGMLATEVRSGDALKPKFSVKTDDKSNKSGNQPQINHRNLSLFLSLHGSSSSAAWSQPLAPPGSELQQSQPERLSEIDLPQPPAGLASIPEEHDEVANRADSEIGTKFYG